VDLVYYGTQQQLEFDFIVAPGADPTRIRLGFQGAEALALDSQGDLILRIAGGELRLRQPFIYQEGEGGKQAIPGQYRVLPRVQDSSGGEGMSHVGVEIAAYDRSKPLIVDPVLSYATYLGGSDSDFGRGIAVDATGAAYVTGQTFSADFPTTPGALQPTEVGGGDAFILKIR
jgi:hypothetical protein